MRCYMTSVSLCRLDVTYMLNGRARKGLVTFFSFMAFSQLWLLVSGLLHFKSQVQQIDGQQILAFLFEIVFAVAVA